MGTDRDHRSDEPEVSDSEMGMDENRGLVEEIEELGRVEVENSQMGRAEVAISQMGRSQSDAAVKLESPIDENLGFSGGGAMEDQEIGDLGFGVSPPLLKKQITENETVIVKDEEDEEEGGEGEEGGGGGEGVESASTVVKPLKGLQEMVTPPFLKKTYHMVEDPSTDSIISWSEARDSFVVWDSFEFSKTLLPKYFKHSNFSSFIRQLNTYGFRKIDCDRWEFANEEFQEGKKHLLKNIKRRSKPPNNNPLVGVSDMTKLGLQTQVETLKKDRKDMRYDIKKLRKQQECAQNQIAAVEERVTLAERKHQQILIFLSNAGKNPNFVQQLIHKSKQKRELDSSKKRRLLAGQAMDTNQSDEKVDDEMLAFPSSYAMPSTGKTRDENHPIALLENEKCVLDSCSANDFNWESDSVVAKDDSNQDSAGDYSKIFYELKDLIVKPCELGT